MNLATTIRHTALIATCLASSTVFAQSAAQSLDAIRSAAQGYVKEHVPSKESGDVVVTVGTLDSRLRLAACGAPLDVSLPAGATFRARMTLAVSCAAGSNWTVFVPVSVETKSSVLVLKHALARGARITEQDVEVQTRMVSGSGDSYLTEVAELSGRTLKRPLGAGAALTADAMTADSLVKRGQQVTLLASAGGMEVRAAGVAMSDAPASGRVKAQNLSSGRIVEGVVETADVIRITP
jgi:flagella basal body P-ring formation protein FlgA